MFVNPIIKAEKTLIIDFLPHKEVKFKKILGSFWYIGKLVKNFKRIPLNITKYTGFSHSKERLKTEGQTKKNETPDCLRFEISSEKMNDLLAHRQICAADIRCLDSNSKQCLKRLCLNTCLYDLNYSNSSSKRIESFPTENNLAIKIDGYFN